MMKGQVCLSIFLMLSTASLVASSRHFIDLTFSFNNETVFFPGRKATFNVEVQGFTPAGHWISSRGFCTSEHTSTHIDAPFHFNKNGGTLDTIPIEDFIDIPGVMIDIYDKVYKFKDNKLTVVENYALTREDILEWEKVNGIIPPRSVVLLRTGWGQRWPNANAYLGYKPEDVPPPPKPDAESTLILDAKLNFPGFDVAAASFLATERNIRGVGIDTLSIDIGSSHTYPSHQLLAGRGVYMIENVANLHLLPPRDFKLWMLPFKIDKGTGAPIRVVASVEK